jgi:hypothetical protein
VVPLAGIEPALLTNLPRTFYCTMAYSVVRRRDSLLYVEVSLCDIVDPLRLRLACLGSVDKWIEGNLKLRRILHFALLKP